MCDWTLDYMRPSFSGNYLAPMSEIVPYKCVHMWCVVSSHLPTLLLPYASVSSSFPRSKPTPHFKPYDMGDQSESTRFRVLFESALQAYEKQTGIMLAEHPLTLQLKSCRSVGSITTLLQDQIPASGDFGGNDKVMTSIRSTISLLSTLSTTAAFDWAVGMVRQVVRCRHVPHL